MSLTQRRRFWYVLYCPSSNSYVTLITSLSSIPLPFVIRHSATAYRPLTNSHRCASVHHLHVQSPRCSRSPRLPAGASTPGSSTSASVSNRSRSVEPATCCRSDHVPSLYHVYKYVEDLDVRCDLYTETWTSLAARPCSPVPQTVCEKVTALSPASIRITNAAPPERKALCQDR
jgi:hypothetical protein